MNIIEIITKKINEKADKLKIESQEIKSENDFWLSKMNKKERQDFKKFCEKRK